MKEIVAWRKRYPQRSARSLSLSHEFQSLDLDKRHQKKTTVSRTWIGDDSMSNIGLPPLLNIVTMFEHPYSFIFLSLVQHQVHRMEFSVLIRLTATPYQHTPCLVQTTEENLRNHWTKYRTGTWQKLCHIPSFAPPIDEHLSTPYFSPLSLVGPSVRSCATCSLALPSFLCYSYSSSLQSFWRLPRYKLETQSASIRLSPWSQGTAQLLMMFLWLLACSPTLNVWLADFLWTSHIDGRLVP